MLVELNKCQQNKRSTWVIPWRRKWCSLSFHKYQPCICGSAGKQSTCNVGDPSSIPGLGRSPGERKGYPFQYSGLENSMDCIVHGITKSQTLLNNFHFTSLHFTKKTAHKGVPKSIPLSLESSKRTLTSQRLWEVLPWGNWFGFNMGVSYFQTPMCLKLWHCILGELPGTMKLRWEKLFSNYVEIFKAQYITMITIIRYFPVYKAISYVSSHFIPINILGTRKGN